MTPQKKGEVQASFSLPGLALFLTALFAVLKWTGAITWSWIWVISPAWIFLGCTLFFLMLLAFSFIAAHMFDRKHNGK